MVARGVSDLGATRLVDFQARLRHDRKADLVQRLDNGGGSAMVGRGDVVQSSDREERDSMTTVMAEQGLGLCC